MTIDCGDCGRRFDPQDWDGESPCPSDDCPSHTLVMEPEVLDDLYNPHGGGEHPLFPRDAWRWAVQEEETLSGYWQWVSHMLAINEESE